MPEEKEDSVGFVKTIKEKVHDWWVSYDRKLWTGRIFVYIGLFLLVIFIGAIVFANFNLFHTDANSARYMLSALVQSQAAIVAIVITLTLIAVQLTASAYSPRVIDIFKKNPDMWILLGCYGVSIFYGFIVLKLVEGAEGEFVSQSVIWSLGPISVSFEFCVSLAYWLGAFTFVALFPYMLDVIHLLKPESIIKRLAVKISSDNLLNSKEDPIQPIVDIVHGSIMKYDLETTRVGLKAVTEQVIKVIDLDGVKEISNQFGGHLMRVSIVAISKMDEYSTNQVIFNLESFGESTAEKELKYATTEAAQILGFVGETAAEKRLEGTILYAVDSLESVGKAAAKKRYEHATRAAVVALASVGKAAAKEGFEGDIGDVLFAIEGLGRDAAKERLDDATTVAAASLECVAKAATEKGFESATSQGVYSLVAVGVIAAKEGLEVGTPQAAWSLAVLTLLSEEIVKTTIQKYELKSQLQDDEPFQKFKKLYEQELEKLRTEK
jgi:hypothetical protein